jgi:CheY-like chemotaxis protein
VDDGEKALAYLAGVPPYADRTVHPLPTLILLDLNLPLRSGFEVLAWVRAQPELRDLPVVIYSSSGRPEDRARATALGATDYLLKPSSGMGFVTVARQVKEGWLDGTSHPA